MRRHCCTGTDPAVQARAPVTGSVLAKGLRLGDQLLNINGNSNFEPNNEAQGTESAWLALSKPDAVTLKIQRADEILTLKVTPAELLPMNTRDRRLDDTPPHIP